MKKIPLNRKNRENQNKIRKMIASGLPLAALMTGLTACNSGFGRPEVVGIVPMKEDQQTNQKKTRKAEPAKTKNCSNEQSQPIAGAMPMQREIQQDIHVVEKGETLHSIAEKYSIDADLLKKLNDLTDEQADRIRIGQKLKIK